MGPDCIHVTNRNVVTKTLYAVGWFYRQVLKGVDSYAYRRAALRLVQYLGGVGPQLLGNDVTRE